MRKCWILQTTAGEISEVKSVNTLRINRVPQAYIRNPKSSIPKPIQKEAVRNPNILNLTRSIILSQWLSEKVDLTIVKILIPLSNLHVWLRKFGRKTHMVCNQGWLFSHVSNSLIRIRGVRDRLSARINWT